jgi:hypothetical protein
VWRGDGGVIEKARLAEPPLTDAFLKAQLAHEGAVYVSLFQALCPDGACALFAAPDAPIQFDDHHLTNEGSILLARRLQELKLVE